MASEGIVFAVIAAVAYAVLNLTQQQASAHINPLLGAAVISVSALLVELLLIAPQARSIAIPDTRFILILAVAGVAAFGVDFFALKSYASGIPLSIGAPIIIGGGIALASLIGLFALGESVTLMKILGILLVVAGASVLASL
ncbi:MAG: EamA family transporter [Candidatus Aenigmarchaeota archaeon]|nr:EamA family transporter [Candidatus Aenigmarchaeota archaeon]